MFHSRVSFGRHSGNTRRTGGALIEMRAKFEGVCAKCHKPIKVGSVIIYSRATRRAWHGEYDSCNGVDEQNEISARRYLGI